MARPKKVTQTTDQVDQPQEANTSTEFETVAEITKQPVLRAVTDSEKKEVVKEALKNTTKSTNLISVTFKGQPRQWTAKTLETMSKAFANEILVNGEKPTKANGGCCG
jgi:CTP-dependent riboflavin kinase